MFQTTNHLLSLCHWAIGYQFWNHAASPGIPQPLVPSAEAVVGLRLQGMAFSGTNVGQCWVLVCPLVPTFNIHQIDFQADMVQLTSKYINMVPEVRIPNNSCGSTLNTIAISSTRSHPAAAQPRSSFTLGRGGTGLRLKKKRNSRGCMFHTSQYH